MEFENFGHFAPDFFKAPSRPKRTHIGHEKLSPVPIFQDQIIYLRESVSICG
jgi:hypothetical protein